MKIQTEQDMIDFCKEVKGPVDIQIYCNLTLQQIARYQIKNGEMIERGALRSFEIEQGIDDISYDSEKGVVLIREIPCLFPAPQVLEKCPEYTAPMTGVLVNAYDPKNKRFLFHMRGRSVDEPFGFQAAAAGFVPFGQGHYITAVRIELKEEEGSSNIIPVIGRKSLAMFPFMKNKVPQPLTGFGFLYDSSNFPAILYPVLSSLEQIIGFEELTKQSLKQGTLQERETYHFNVPLSSIGGVVRNIYDRDPSQTGKNGGFFGPIAESHEIFFKFLKDNGYIQ